MTRKSRNNGHGNGKMALPPTTTEIDKAETALNSKFPFAIDETRLDFLQRFESLKPQLNSYVLICGIRSRIGDTSVNLLPEEEILDLPSDMGFFRRFFGRGTALNEFIELQGMACRLDAKAISTAAATAIQLGRTFYKPGLETTSENQRLINLLRAITVMLARIMAKISSRSEAYLHLERARLRRDYKHHKAFRAVLTLTIEFDRNIRKLTKLDQLKDLQDNQVLIDELTTNIQLYYGMLIRACTELELSINDQDYPESALLQDSMLEAAFLAHRQLEKERQARVLIEDTMQGALEILDEGAAFDEELERKKA
ncbi:hypothetical protein IT411_01000 [Candidatus Peregrinibacteria bacterium]|nr:hypothetical protein [Candidatus Peregrinibacteria bacterium]